MTSLRPTQGEQNDKEDISGLEQAFSSLQSQDEDGNDGSGDESYGDKIDDTQQKEEVRKCFTNKENTQNIRHDTSPPLAAFPTKPSCRSASATASELLKPGAAKSRSRHSHDMEMHDATGKIGRYDGTAFFHINACPDLAQSYPSSPECSGVDYRESQEKDCEEEDIFVEENASDDVHLTSCFSSGSDKPKMFENTPSLRKKPLVGLKLPPDQ